MLLEVLPKAILQNPKDDGTASAEASFFPAGWLGYPVRYSQVRLLVIGAFSLKKVVSEVNFRETL